MQAKRINTAVQQFYNSGHEYPDIHVTFKVFINPKVL